MISFNLLGLALPACFPHRGAFFSSLLSCNEIDSRTNPLFLVDFLGARIPGVRSQRNLANLSGLAAGKLPALSWSSGSHSANSYDMIFLKILRVFEVIFLSNPTSFHQF